MPVRAVRLSGRELAAAAEGGRLPLQLEEEEVYDHPDDFFRKYEVNQKEKRVPDSVAVFVLCSKQPSHGRKASRLRYWRRNWVSHKLGKRRRVYTSGTAMISAFRLPDNTSNWRFQPFSPHFHLPWSTSAALFQPFDIHDPRPFEWMQLCPQLLHAAMHVVSISFRIQLPLHPLTRFTCLRLHRVHRHPMRNFQMSNGNGSM